MNVEQLKIELCRKYSPFFHRSLKDKLQPSYHRKKVCLGNVWFMIEKNNPNDQKNNHSATGEYTFRHKIFPVEDYLSLHFLTQHFSYSATYLKNYISKLCLYNFFQEYKTIISFYNISISTPNKITNMAIGIFFYFLVILITEEASLSLYAIWREIWKRSLWFYSDYSLQKFIFNEKFETDFFNPA